MCIDIGCHVMKKSHLYEFMLFLGWKQGFGEEWLI